METKDEDARAEQDASTDAADPGTGMTLSVEAHPIGDKCLRVVREPEEALALMPSPRMRNGAEFQLAPGAEFERIEPVEQTGDFVTVVKSLRGAPSNKVVDLCEGEWLKKAAGGRARVYGARTATVSSPEALAATVRVLGPDEFLIAGWVPGSEDGKPFGLVAEWQLSEWLGLPKGSFPLGRFKIPGAPLWLVGRFGENFQFSTWVPFDADAHPEMPAALGWASSAEWRARMHAKHLLPGNERAVLLRSNSARVLLGGAPVYGGGGSFRYYVQTEPSAYRPSEWVKPLLIRAHNAGLGWMKPSHSKSSGAVVSAAPWSIFDPSTLRTPVQPEFDGPPSLGNGAKAAGAEVAPAQIEVFAGIRWDVSAVHADEDALAAFSRSTGRKAELHHDGHVRGITWVEENLRLDLLVETADGSMTVEAFWRGSATHVRAQVPAEFRESESMNAYLGRHRDGSAFLYDNGPGVKHVLPQHVREQLEETLAWERIEALPLAERKVRWPDFAAPLAPDAQSRIIARLADDAEMDTGREDLRKRLADALGRHRRREAAGSSKAKLEARRVGRTQVVVNPMRLDETAQVIGAAITKSKARFPIYVRDDKYVMVTTRVLPYTHGERGEDDQPPAMLCITDLDKESFRAKQESSVQLVQKEPDGALVEVSAEKELIFQVLGMPQKPGDQLTGVLPHPTVLPDGEILATPGLHKRTGLFFDFGSTDFEGLRPFTQSEAREGRLRLHELMLAGTFPETPLDAEVVAMAFPMAGITRKVVSGGPHALITASMPESGKTKAAVRLGVVLSGTVPAMTRWPRDDDEMEKRAGAIARRGPVLILFDNATNGLTLRSDFLATFSTESKANIRILGESEYEVIPAAFIVITGNNLSLATDEVSRYLEARLMKPPDGTEYRHDAAAHAREHRVEILRLLIGVISGYLTSGVRMKRSSRFPESWDRMVRQAILWAGGEDVGKVYERNATDSEELQATGGVVAVLRELFADQAFHPSDVMARLNGAGFHDEADEAGRERLHRLQEDLISLRADVRSTKSVGWALTSIKGNLSPDGKWKLVKLPKRQGYRVEQAAWSLRDVLFG